MTTQQLTRIAPQSGCSFTRAREMAFQGSINPMLKNFGERSEASQYSGRAVSDNWPCPFHAHKKDET